MRSARRAAASILFIAAVSLAAMAGGDQAPAHHDWGYDGAHGPQHWGEVSPEYAACSEGKQQSPIDIEDVVKADLPPIVFDYHPSALEIIDNGHSIQVNYAPGSAITVEGQRYELQQFHFHKPSEELIHGHSFPMVIHLVHKSAAGKLAVVAVELKYGKPNALVETLWKHLPKEKGKIETDAQVTVDASAFLPADRGYYTFTGSLTTPPCTEGVTWFVLKSPGEVSKEEVAKFGHIYSHDARPVQPLNGRVVQASR